MGASMNCSDCLDRLDLFVDRELGEADLVEVRYHLQCCPVCEHLFELRTDLKRLVRACCCDRVQADSSLRDRVRGLLT
jgi:anti-sigma factor (TIGR02949 family)